MDTTNITLEKLMPYLNKQDIRWNYEERNNNFGWSKSFYNVVDDLIIEVSETHKIMNLFNRAKYDVSVTYTLSSPSVQVCSFEDNKNKDIKKLYDKLYESKINKENFDKDEVYNLGNKNLTELINKQ